MPSKGNVPRKADLENKKVPFEHDPCTNLSRPGMTSERNRHLEERQRKFSEPSTLTAHGTSVMHPVLLAEINKLRALYPCI